MSIKKVYVFYCLLFVLIGIVSLNLNYIEGDDARTILFHVFGRDASFQPPYSPYHSMFDTLLSLISTQNEETLRVVGIIISMVFSLVVLMSIAKIIHKVFGDEKPQVFWFLLLLPFIIPEMLFSGLIMNPTNISFALVLLSHLFLITYMETSKVKFLLWAIVLFGLGVSFRWSCGFYIFVLFGHFIFSKTTGFKALFSVEKFKKSLLIFPFFILSVIIWIQISGYAITDIYDVYVHSAQYIETKELSLLAVAATAISFTTPALALILLFGVIYCIRKRSYWPLALLFISILPYFTMGIIPMYKYMITIVLPLVIVMTYGVVSIQKKSLMYVLYGVVFIPWILGLQVNSNTAWGPGFEVRSIVNSDINEVNFNPDRSTSIKDVNVVIGSGMAMPTSEGPRPLFGFGKVLLSDWNFFVENHNSERESSVNYAIENNCNILQDVNHSFITSKLCELGYMTEDKMNASNAFGVHRTFNNVENEISVDVFKNKKALFNSELMNSYMLKHNQVVVYSSYTNIMTKLKSKYKDQFKQQGAFWGILTWN